MKYRGDDTSRQLSERITDIEDLVVEGSRNRVCPYFLARAMNSEADLVFMPYNYILDIKSRRAHGIELKNNVVIFDEAHNIERMCEDSASVDLTAYDITCCIQDVNKCIEGKQKLKDGLPGASGDLALVDGDISDIDRDLEGMYCVKSILLQLEKQLDSINITTAEGVTKPGSFIQEMFLQCNLKYDNFVLVSEQCDKMLLQLTTDGKGFSRSFTLQKFSDMIRTVFATSSDSVSCYKVHISIRSDFTWRKGNDTWTSTARKQPETVRVLSYWCFSPGYAMEELRQSGVYCVVLTSGTLTPLSSFSSELKIPFPISIESPHVIEKHQVMCGVLTCGPGNTTLNSSYQTRFDKAYLDSLGKAVLGFSQSVPQGLLVFFASYPLMYKCIDTWKENGMWAKLADIKPPFVEPKGKVDFNQTIEGYYEKIRDPEHNAAIFFAVCRGKVAEGLDFADMNGRAVIITGLPFPPKMEPKVRLKMAYLDEQIKNAGYKSEKREEVLTGSVWYRQQAFRAVNQAIGRVIRHKMDFGAILLCDTRFSSREAIAQLPNWVQPVTKVYKKYDDIQQQLVAFFKFTKKVVRSIIQK
jgi:regulator of telomere elongation helicase 1